MTKLPRDLAIYRTVAWVTGLGTLLLFLVAMPLRYFADQPTVSEVYSPIHGVIFMAYVGIVVWVASRRAWGPGKALGVVLAGVLPFGSFVVERRVVATELRRTDVAAT